jgi:hypothetical protein
MTATSYPFSKKLCWQDHRILCSISPPENTQNGIVEYLRVFGKLYAGSVKKSYFDILYKERLTFLQTIASLTTLDEKSRSNLGFNLYMLRLALVTDQWRLPGLANNAVTVTGNSRLWVTGMCKPQSHTFLNYFEFCNHPQQPKLIEDPVEITTTRQLHNTLKIDYLIDQADPDVQFDLVEYVDNNNSIKLRINSIQFKDDPNVDRHDSVGDPYLLQFLSWRNRYLPNPTISIYTNWPELIEDSSGVWDIQFSGDITNIKKTIFLPGHIERAIREVHENQSSASSHIMHVVDPVKIDLGELLFWMDTEHTTYIDKNFSYIVYRQDIDYKTTFVSVSENK